MHKYWPFALFVFLCFNACNPAKHIAEDQYVYRNPGFLDYGSNIIIENDDIKIVELANIIKQQPNRRILGLFRFHMWMYPKDTLKIQEKIAENHLKHDQKNLERLEAGKDTLEYKPCGIEKRMKKGEPVAIYDSLLTQKTTNQMNLYLIKKGYFHNVVRDSVIFNDKKQTATVYYLVDTREPYTIRNITYNINDDLLKKYVNFYKATSVLDSGAVFDIDLLEKERNSVTTYLRDRGYHFFTKDYITFEIDSTLGVNQVDIFMNFENIKKKSPINPDEVIEVTHKRYQINKIFINTDYSPDLGDDIYNYDSTEYNGLIFLYQDELRYSTKLLSQFVFVSAGEMYRQKDIESTLRRFNSSGVFRSVNIRYEISDEDPTGLSLDCYINLRPSKRQAFSMQADGTNKGGNLGIRGNVSYSNKNTFKGAELFQFSVSGSIEEQPLFEEQADEGTVVQQVIPFNTMEFGPQLSLNFPKFLLPIAPDRFKKTFQPRTVLSAALNLQSRPDYSRNLQSYSWTYEWGKTNDQNLNTVYHRYQLLEFNIWDIRKESQTFIDYLGDLNNAALSSSYSDHVILGSQYSVTYSSSLFHTGKDKVLAKGTFGAAGLLLRSIHQFMDKKDLFNVSQNESGKYKLIGIPYSQYVRVEGDIRYYHTFNQSSKVVFRAAGGIGLPYGNGESLPFEKSFYTGGANGLRAWKARTIGPGSYKAVGNESIPDKIGEILIEGNIEYRFDMLGAFEGAFFVDIGNVWTLDSVKQGSKFTTDFWREFAIGVGFGARFDFDFFIIRLDLGTPIHDPRRNLGKRWLWTDGDNYPMSFNWNFGIGYPF